MGRFWRFGAFQVISRVVPSVFHGVSVGPMGFHARSSSVTGSFRDLRGAPGYFSRFQWVPGQSRGFWEFHVCSKGAPQSFRNVPASYRGFQGLQEVPGISRGVP